MDESQTPPENLLTAETTPNHDLVMELESKLKTGSAAAQLQAIADLASSEAGQTVLMNYLQSSSSSPSFVVGKAYELLLGVENQQVSAFLQTHFPLGVVPLNSEKQIDYQPLQKLLAQQDFQAADQLTLEKLCQLASPAAVQRRWLYFTEVDRIPLTDLQTINQLWLAHSEGKFGFSVQRQIWLGVGKNWEAFWPKIGWKSGNQWTRYPQEFTWNLTAPKGHLPLSNQLRGIQVIKTLLSHPAWSSSKG